MEQVPLDPPPKTNAPERGDSPRVIFSEELFQGRREVWIEHRGEMYRLRVTASGRLCLNK